MGPVFSFYSTKELRHNVIVNTFCNVHKGVTVKSLIQVCVCVCVSLMPDFHASGLFPVRKDTLVIGNAKAHSAFV